MDDQRIREFRRTLRQFQRLSAAQLKSCSCGVTLPQCLVLLEIDEHGRLTMGQLAAHLRLDHSTLSRTVDGLVRQGLLARSDDPDDRRRVWVGLTASGRATCEEIHALNDAHCREILTRIAPGKVDEVIRSFDRLVEAYLEHEDGLSD